MAERSDSELIDALEKYIKVNDYIMIHNTHGSDDSRWPKGYVGGGFGLLPWRPIPIREVLNRIAKSLEASRG